MSEIDDNEAPEPIDVAIPAQVLANREAIWEILFIDKDDINKSVGVSVAHNRLLTVHHGVSFTTKKIKARRASTTTYRYLEIEHGRKGFDLLLLKFKCNNYRSPCQLKVSNNDNLDFGDERWLVGNHDYDRNAFIEQIVVVSESEPDMLEGLNSFIPNPITHPPRTYTVVKDIDDRSTASPNVPVILIAPFLVSPGHSGSPIVDDIGEIVGLLKGFAESSPREGWRVAIHGSVIREFLEEANLARERAYRRRSLAVGFSSFARFRRGAMELPL